MPWVKCSRLSFRSCSNGRHGFGRSSARQHTVNGVSRFYSVFLTALIVLSSFSSMSDWKNEDDIKAELRAMTDELRRLREGLRNMVSPPQKPNPTRAFLHRQSWPPEPAEPAEPKTSEPPKAEAADRKRGKRRK